ncbi:hypothetical protein Acr_00g0035630 [Actinidia rufa]|uniref:Uncharacterized protein n=1 Tax=Actinidia rufa TaxID=165716 RepID=A0A7J0DI91_9ERIC|nr:hypothetical protein Acr_00g0035630 [Actinidia rufa]
MIDKVNQLPSSPREDPHEVSPPWDDSSDHGEDPGMVTHSPLETLVNDMTQGILDHLTKTYTFPAKVQARIPAKGETILSSRPSKVAFYEATFPVGLKFSVYPTIKRILNFYNICPAQLSLNAWRCVICVLVIWQFFRMCLKGLPTTLKAGRRNSSSSQGTIENSSRVLLQMKYREFHDHGAPRTFHRFFTPSRGKMSSSGRDKDASRDGLVAASGDEIMSKRIGLAKLVKKVDGKKDNEVSKVDTLSNIGVVQDLVINDSKGKEASPPPKAKKPKPSKTASKGTTRPATPEEGSSKKPAEVNYGCRCFRDGKCLCGRENSCWVILPADKEKVVKLSLDQVVTKFIHILGQVNPPRKLTKAMEIYGTV